jgi:hypothetical protein
MGKVIDRKVTDTSHYNLEITKANGEVVKVSGIGHLKRARHEAKLELGDGAVQVQIFACSYYLDLPPKLVQTIV